MKRKSLILSIILAVFGLFSAFTFAGCGVSLSDLKTSFDSLAKSYSSYSDVFKTGSIFGRNSKYVVDYGEAVNKSVENDKEGYKELSNKYNVMLLISAEYIDSYKGLILNYNEKKMTKDAKKSFKDLDESISDCKKKIKAFVNRRSMTISYFSQFDEYHPLPEDSEKYQIRRLKETYGELVGASIKVATNLAKTIEETKIYDLLKSTGLTASDGVIVKDLVQIKLLPIYDEFFITEISDKIFWDVYVGDNTRLDDLVSDTEERFAEFKTGLVNKTTNYKSLSVQETKRLFKNIEEFFREAKYYFNALKDFNISDFAVYYNCDLAKYTKKKPFAERDLEKMEQFTQKTLSNFLGMVGSYIFSA